MRILVLNAGSASIKFQLIQTDGQADGANDRRLARGSMERIGGEAIVRLATDGQRPSITARSIRNHREAVEYIISWLTSEGLGIGSAGGIDAVGHRVVHGGEHFAGSTLVDDDVLQKVEGLIELAPLHNPHNLAGIRAARAVFGSAVPHVVVFDTSFHQTLPETAFLYAIPYELYRRHRVRRYGFHGTSHRYVAQRYGQVSGRSLENSRLITLHLGNGASACAISGGRSVDTSMGFTPLEGLVMGTRSGDLDPAILDYLSAKEGLTVGEIDTLLNKRSGLLGISGLTADMRELLAEEAENGDRRAHLAIEIFCYRVKKYLGAYLAAMNGADAVIFAGGIGENAAAVR
ncbi:MAG: acetate kinase, partial [Gemmatimonadetes bacterium]|nr:acetate kinase [Gemmatimonadota bacterium]